MTPDIVIELLKILVAPLKKVYKSYRLWRYKRKSVKPPITEEDAEEIAYVTLSGQIKKVISYRNIVSKKNYIAVSYKPNEEDYATRIVILEQVGESYRIRWKMEYQTSIVDFEVEDIDKDGTQEIIIRSLTGGTGSTTSFLTVYSQRYNVSYTISETRDRQNLAGPIIPQIEFDPEPPSDLKNALERCAVKRGFLTSRPQIDWNDVRYAIERWHHDNGPNPDGKINAIFYDGQSPVSSSGVPSDSEPSRKNLPFSSSIIKSHDDGKIIWISYFKNPLVGYIKDSNKWFIAYSPSNFYEWACSLAYDGKRLWFGVHALEAIYSFQFDTMQLHRHRSIYDINFEMDSTVSYKNGRLHINESISLAQNELDEVIRKIEEATGPKKT